MKVGIMRSSLFTLLLVVVVSLATLGLGTGWTLRATSPAALAPATIAVIDLEAIFEAAPSRPIYEEEIKSYLNGKLKELEEAGKELEKLKKEIKLVKAGTDTYRDLEERIAQREGMFSLHQEQFKRAEYTRRLEAHGKVVAEIKAAVLEYATEHGLDLVLQRMLPVGEDLPPWEIVFHSRQDLDVTEGVIEQLKRNSNR